jgi:hypothetical protein
VSTLLLQENLGNQPAEKKRMLSRLPSVQGKDRAGHSCCLRFSITIMLMCLSKQLQQLNKKNGRQKAGRETL